MTHGSHPFVKVLPTLREWLSDQPFSLAMSSGFFGFFAHTGVVEVLEAENLLPRRLSGSSAGALVAGAFAAGLAPARLADALLRLERKDFWDPTPGPGLLAGRLFREKLESLLPVATFEACRTELSLSVFDLRTRTTRVLDRGPLAPAIHASCAVPFMFHPVRHAGSWLVDGGVADRPGLLGMRHDERVLFHHLASRSPWRRKNGAWERIPARDGLVTLVLDGLPRSGPFALENGRRAYELAKQATRRALDRPHRSGDAAVVREPV